jgi:adenine-specific DNA glycosylase
MMELGATICTPTSPACSLCPWLSLCSANKNGLVDKLPLKRPQKDKTQVLINLQFLVHGNHLAFINNDSLPFLKNTLLPPANMRIVKKRPIRFDFKHSITSYQIYVTVQTKKVNRKLKGYHWHLISEAAKVNPSSLLKKSLVHLNC